jgi:hypothetical protein
MDSEQINDSIPTFNNANIGAWLEVNFNMNTLEVEGHEVDFIVAKKGYC